MMGARSSFWPVAAAVLLATWVGAGALFAQEAVGGEGAIPTPTPGATTVSLDTESLMPTLYLLVVLVAGVAVLVTIMLALGRGDITAKQKASEGERRLGRMLDESETDFKEGRERGQLPTQMT